VTLQDKSYDEGCSSTTQQGFNRPLKAKGDAQEEKGVYSRYESQYKVGLLDQVKLGGLYLGRMCLYTSRDCLAKSTSKENLCKCRDTLQHCETNLKGVTRHQGMPQHTATLQSCPCHVIIHIT
jgi:hypothetical protein